jgi:hypothetical protein
MPQICDAGPTAISFKQCNATVCREFDPSFMIREQQKAHVKFRAATQHETNHLKPVSSVYVLFFLCVLYCSFFLYFTASVCDVHAATLTEVFLCFFLSCKANVRV